MAFLPTLGKEGFVLLEDLPEIGDSDTGFLSLDL
jgi:hypothetical protein